MAIRELEVEEAQESVAFHLFAEENGGDAPDRPWCREYEEVE